MSVEAISEVKRRKMKPAHKFLAMLLADYCDPRWRCFPGVPRLAKESGYSERQVKRLLDELETAGIITREAHFSDSGRQLASSIFLSAEGLAALPLAVPSGPEPVDNQGCQDDTPVQVGGVTSEQGGVTSATNGASHTSLKEPSVEPSVLAAVAADNPDDPLSTSTAKVSPLKPPDPTKVEARRLAQVAFEQTPKPVCAGGFVGVMKLIQRFLEAGHDPTTLELVIANGQIKTWTLAAMTYQLDTAVAKKPSRQAPRNVYLDLLNGTEA